MSLDRLDSERQRWVPVVNTTSENIPPYAAMEVIGCVLPGDTTYPNEIGAFKVRKPASDDLISNVLFADASGIGSNGAGIGTLHFPAIVHYEYPGSVAGSSSGASGSTSVETGTTLGTKADSWYLAVDGFGFASIGTGTEYGDGDRGYTSANLSTAPPAGTTIREIQGLCVTRCSDDTQGSGSTPGVPTGMVLLGNTTWCIGRELTLTRLGSTATNACTGSQTMVYDEATQKWVAAASGDCPGFQMRWNPIETRFEWSYDAGATWVEDEFSYGGSFTGGGFIIVFRKPASSPVERWQWSGAGDPTCTETSGGGDPIGSAPIPGPSGDPGCNAITDVRLKVREKDVRTGQYVGASYCLVPDENCANDFYCQGGDDEAGSAPGDLEQPPEVAPIGNYTVPGGCTGSGKVIPGTLWFTITNARFMTLHPLVATRCIDCEGLIGQRVKLVHVSTGIWQGLVRHTRESHFGGPSAPPKAGCWSVFSFSLCCNGNVTLNLGGTAIPTEWRELNQAPYCDNDRSDVFETTPRFIRWASKTDPAADPASCSHSTNVATADPFRFDLAEGEFGTPPCLEFGTSAVHWACSEHETTTGDSLSIEGYVSES